jgi:hypothetical protein
MNRTSVRYVVTGYDSQESNQRMFWLVTVNFKRVSYWLCHIYVLLWINLFSISVHFRIFIRRMWLKFSKFIKGNTNLFYNYRTRYVCKSSFRAVEDHGDWLFMFGYQHTSAITGTRGCTGTPRNLTFEIDIACDKDTLSQSLVTEALRLQPSGHVNGETFDSLCLRVLMLIECPEMAEWGCCTRCHYIYEEKTYYGNEEWCNERIG